MKSLSGSVFKKKLLWIWLKKKNLLIIFFKIILLCVARIQIQCQQTQKNVFCIEAEKIRGIPNENPESNPNRMDYVIRKYMSSTM